MSGRTGLEFQPPITELPFTIPADGWYWFRGDRYHFSAGTTIGTDTVPQLDPMRGAPTR